MILDYTSYDYKDYTIELIKENFLNNISWTYSLYHNDDIIVDSLEIYDMNDHDEIIEHIIKNVIKN